MGVRARLFGARLKKRAGVAIDYQAALPECATDVLAQIKEHVDQTGELPARGTHWRSSFGVFA